MFWPKVLLVAVGLAARLGVAIWLGLGKPPEPGSDPAEYDQYAWNVAQGRGYRGTSTDVSDTDHVTAYRPPGTSLVWAGLFRVFGHRYEVVRVLNCVLGAATGLFVLSIGRGCFDDRTGWLAACAWSIFPTSLLYSTELLSESLTVFCFCAYLTASLKFADRPSFAAALIAGVCLGITLLVHPTKVLMVPLAAMWGLWQFRRDWRAVIQSLTIPVVAVALLMPWTIRNYYVFHEFIPFSTMGGSVLLQGNNRLVVSDPSLYGYNVWDTKIPEYKQALEAPNDELERDKVAKTLAIQWLRDNPDQWAFMLQAKFRRAWTPFLQPHSPRLYRVGTLVSWGPVLILFSLAFFPTLVSFLKNGKPGWLLHLAVMHFVALSLIFFGYSRYRYPIEPICLVLAASTVTYTLSLLSRRSIREQPKSDRVDRTVASSGLTGDH